MIATQVVATFPIATFDGGIKTVVVPPSTDGTSGGRGRILRLRDKPLVFTDRPTPVHIEDIQPNIEALKEELEDLETREVRIHHLLMAAKGAQKAAMQLKRLEAIQARIRERKAMLEDEEALVIVLALL